LARVIEGFDVDVFGGWADVGESPGDALVVAHNHEGHTGQGDSRHIEVTAGEVGLVPEVRHLMLQVHVVGQQRKAGNGVCT
jgi:hypothetical protein